MVEHKYVLFFGVNGLVIYILHTDTDSEQEEIGPYLTKQVYKIATPELSKKRSNYYQGEYQDQKRNEHNNSVKAVDGLYKTQKILHNSIRR